VIYLETAFRVEINIVSMLVLLAVFLIAHKKLEKKDSMNKIFLVASLIVMIELIVEALSCIVNGMAGTFNIILSNVLAILLFSFAPILSYTFFVFIKQIFSPKMKISKPLQFILIIPVIIIVMLSVLSPFFGWMFYIDSLGVYHRGPIFQVGAIFTYLYLVLGLIVVCVNRKHLLKSDFLLYSIIGILPIIGGIVQTLFYGILLMWSSAAFALVIGYILLQERMIHLDDLTGAWTRDSFYYTISRKITQDPNEIFGMIYLDIDGLKAINDRFGHLEGDKAIQKALELVKNAISPKDIIGRLGGDEFVVFVECTDLISLNLTLDNIKNNFKMYQNQKYELECSFGADIYDNQYENLDVFLHHIDHLMYKDKRTRKSQ
jgi:diguanylate cyclase (GGDEF)-like protein